MDIVAYKIDTFLLHLDIAGSAYNGQISCSLGIHFKKKCSCVSTYIALQQNLDITKLTVTCDRFVIMEILLY